MAGRLVLFGGVLVVFFAVCGEVARGEGKYQSTKDGKALVWNSDPRPGDVVTWSGDRDSSDYAHGFGQLVWYTREPGFDKPQLYARYWGRMTNGKLEGPVNVHSKRKTHYAIFIDGARVTGWTNGTAPSGATARWSMMVAKRSRTNVEEGERREERASDFAKTSDVTSRRGEPESPATGPTEEKEEGQGQKAETETRESIQDLYDERWPKIDIDESLRLLAFPPRTLRK